MSLFSKNTTGGTGNTGGNTGGGSTNLFSSAGSSNTGSLFKGQGINLVNVE